MHVSGQSRDMHRACECRFMHRVEVCSENMSAGACRIQMLVLGVKVQICAESRSMQ